MEQFSHLDANGGLTMVDVGAKVNSERVAIAEGFVEVSEKTLDLLKKQALPKGDVLTCAKIAGIMAAKRTAELIPLCHPLLPTFIDLRFEILDAKRQIRVEAEARNTGQTGVEMEAIIAVQIATATIYDMCKAVQKDIVIRKVRLIRKEGGKSGTFIAKDID